MKRVFLIRHGETDWNKMKIFRGSSEVPLNETGRKQVKRLGKYFSNIDLELIYSSPRIRAFDTAFAVSNGKIDIVKEEGFADINRGEWEGLSHKQVKRKWPCLYNKWFSRPQNMKFPKGESIEAVKRRSAKSFDTAVRGKENIAIVSHHVTLRILLCSILGLESAFFRKMELYTASVTELRLERGIWVLHKLNDNGNYLLNK
ncbi:MAG: histidine phosphatase family protein [Elusimicrobiota bacterium]